MLTTGGDFYCFLISFSSLRTSFSISGTSSFINIIIKLTNKSPHETQMVRMLKNLMKYPPSPAPIANIMIIAQ